MHLMCFRACCHEVIHLVQFYAGQGMHGQLAEHDGYFATDLLACTVAALLFDGVSGGISDGVGGAGEGKGSEAGTNSSGGGGGSSGSGSGSGSGSSVDADLLYPGIMEVTQRMMLSTTKRRLAKAGEVDGFDMASYTAWRDSFGAGVGLWNDKNFNSSWQVRGYTMLYSV